MRSRVGALLLIAILVAVGCTGGDDQVLLREADPPGIPCELGTPTDIEPAIDLGALGVDDLRNRAERRGEAAVLEFDVVIDAATADSSQVILQARAPGSQVSLRALDGAAAVQRVSTAAVLALARCDQSTRYRVEVELVAPGCVFIIGADPEEASFAQLPVPMLVDSCGDAALAPAE